MHILKMGWREGGREGGRGREGREGEREGGEGGREGKAIIHIHAVLKPQGTHHFHSLYPGLPLAGLGNVKVKALIVDEAHTKGKPIRSGLRTCTREHAQR